MRNIASTNKTLSALKEELAKQAATLKEVERNELLLIRMNDLAFEILQTRSLSELFRFLCEALPTRMRVDAAALRIVDPESRVRELLRIDGKMPMSELFAFNESEDSLARLVRRKLFSNAGTASHSRTQSPAHYFVRLSPFSKKNHAHLFSPKSKGIKTVAVLPLFRPGSLLGVLCLGSKDLERFSPGLATDFLQFLSVATSIALSNQIYSGELKEIGLVDGLTRVFNRRYLDTQLQEEVRIAQKDRTSITCLMIDADHFKRVNDEHGHEAGDQALKHIAKHLRRALKSRDILARYGGEEFVVVASGLKKADASQLAERLRLEIQDNPLSLKQSTTPLSLSVSIGVAWLRGENIQPESADAAAALLRRADEGVYKAKGNGRNRVCFIAA